MYFIFLDERVQFWIWTHSFKRIHVDLSSCPHLVWKFCNCTHPSLFPSFHYKRKLDCVCFKPLKEAFSPQISTCSRKNPEVNANSQARYPLFGVSLSLSGHSRDGSVTGGRNGPSMHKGFAKISGLVGQGGIMVLVKLLRSRLIQRVRHFSPGDETIHHRLGKDDNTEGTLTFGKSPRVLA